MNYHKEENVHIDPKLYNRFLDIVTQHFTVKPVKEHDEETEDKVCLLRHDIDGGAGGGLWGAMQMANIEHERGVRSTYYVIHTARYYRDNRSRLAAKCRQLEQMNHEVGFHNDILTMCLKDRTQHPSDVFSAELNFLKVSGLHIYGVSTHGSLVPKKLGVYSNQIFEGCQPTDSSERRDNVQGIPLNTIKLADYNLYETSFIPVDYYISDSGGKWKSTKHHEFALPMKTRGIPHNDFEKYLEKLSQRKDVTKIMVLTHPGTWYREKFKAFRRPFGGME